MLRSCGSTSPKTEKNTIVIVSPVAAVQVTTPGSGVSLTHAEPSMVNCHDRVYQNMKYGDDTL